MVVSVHPLCQDIPLKILSYLDSNGQTRDAKARTTPFATVVTDLGGAHPTWFNPGYVFQTPERPFRPQLPTKSVFATEKIVRNIGS